MTQPIRPVGPHLLGRRIQHDPRSRAFPAAMAPVTASEPVLWAVHGAALNQGELGSCTANALAQWLNTSPERVKGTKLATEKATALPLYHEETVLQGGPVWPPADPGGSGLAVCKAAVKLGLIAGYKHAFGIEHARGAIAVSPFIVGSNWFQSFFTPDADGLVSIDESQICAETGSPVAGGHEYLCRSYDPTTGLWGFRNSWGPRWGAKGSFFMTDATFSRLLSEQGDVTVPVPLGQPKPAPAAVFGDTRYPPELGVTEARHALADAHVVGDPTVVQQAQYGLNEAILNTRTAPRPTPATPNPLAPIVAIVDAIPEAARAWIYRVTCALIPLLAAYGFIASNKVALFSGLVAAIFPAGLAARNTDPKAKG